MILRVGLTGGIASGKSTIAHHLGELGCFTLDADKLVAELYRPGNAGHAALVAAYGDSILRPDREIDRARLADIAFSSPAAIERLNAMVHPLVMAEADRIVDETAARHGPGDLIAVVEATLLIEAGGRDRYDRIVVVDVDHATQLRRGMARGMAREDLERRIAHQMTREERLRWADYVVDNRGSAEEARAATTAVYEALRQDLARKAG